MRSHKTKYNQPIQVPSENEEEEEENSGGDSRDSSKKGTC